MGNHYAYRKRTKRACALKVYVEIVCRLGYILHFLLKEKELAISEAKPMYLN